MLSQGIRETCKKFMGGYIQIIPNWSNGIFSKLCIGDNMFITGDTEDFALWRRQRFLRHRNTFFKKIRTVSANSTQNTTSILSTEITLVILNNLLLNIHKNIEILQTKINFWSFLNYFKNVTVTCQHWWFSEDIRERLFAWRWPQNCPQRYPREDIC